MTVILSTSKSNQIITFTHVTSFDIILYIISVADPQIYLILIKYQLLDKLSSDMTIKIIEDVKFDRTCNAFDRLAR